MNLGSPPHLRGKPEEKYQKLLQVRITPAPAGKTRTFFALQVFKRDHPRTCGENPPWTWTLHKRKGSPPHLRGKL